MKKEEYKQPFIDRVRWARQQRFATQELFCDVFQIKQPIYSKYETETMMPHYLLVRFAKTCGVSLEFLLTDPRNAQVKTKIPAPMPRPKHKRKSRPRRKPAKIA